MTASLATRSLAPVRMTLWRDRDPAAMALPGMSAGLVERLHDPVEDVSRFALDGIQFARLLDTVDLGDHDGAAAVAALVVVRELTGHGIAVDWTVRLPAALTAGGDGWRVLSHLHPPNAVLAEESGESSDGGEDIAARWRASFHAAKCGYRQGPGFIEIRDRRADSFRRLVIKSTRHDEMIEPLLRGVPAAALPDAVAASYLKANLLHQVGQYLWWTPYRIRRWPLSTTIP